MSVTSDQDINWKITQGESFDLQLQYVDPDENPINISGIDVVMEVKDRPGGRIVSAKLRVNDGITITDANNGIFDIRISPTRTRNFNYPRSAYEILGTDQYGENILFLQGWFEVNAGVI
jgi:hypothetical protein